VAPAFHPLGVLGALLLLAPAAVLLLPDREETP